MTIYLYNSFVLASFAILHLVVTFIILSQTTAVSEQTFIVITVSLLCRDFTMAEASGQELTSEQLSELYRVETSVNVDAAGAVIRLSPAIATFLVEQGQVSI